MSTLLAILVANTLIAALLATGGWAAMRFGRTPWLAHCFWVLALIKLVTPPVVPIPVGWQLRPERFFVESRPATPEASSIAKPEIGSAPFKTTPTAAPAENKVGTATTSSARNTDHKRRLRIPCTWNTFAIGLGSVWLVGSCTIALLLAWRAQAFQRSLDRCISPDGELSRRTWRLARRAGLARAPQVLVADALLSPMLWGIGKRVRLIFPAGLQERLSEDEIDALLLHELGHFARGDHHVRVLELISRIVFWWHPLMWVALSHIEEAEEHCCDAWVLTHQQGRERSYAEALLATIDFLNEEHVLVPPTASGLGDARLLRKRLVEIMAGDRRPILSAAGRRLAWTAGGLLLLLHPALGNVSWSLPTRPYIHAPQAKTASTWGQKQEQDTKPSGNVAQSTLNQEVVPPVPSIPLTNSRWSALHPPASLWASATSPGGAYRLEARSGRRATLVHVASGRQIDLSSYHIACVVFHPDGQSFFTGDEEGFLREWNCETGEVLHWWRGHSREISSVHISPDGEQLVSGSLDGFVKIWQTEDQGLKKQYPLGSDVISCVRWSPDGSRLATAVGGWSEGVHPELIVLNLESGAESRFDLEQPAGAINWLKDPHLLITASWDGRAIVWDLEAGGQRWASVVLKEEVSSAAWCAHCPLTLRLAAEDL